MMINDNIQNIRNENDLSAQQAPKQDFIALYSDEGRSPTVKKPFQ